MKRIATVVLASLSIAVAPTIRAEQITTVGIVDVRKVYEGFYGSDRAAQEIELLRERYQQEIDAQLQIIEEIRLRRDEAIDAGDNGLVEQINAQITQVVQTLRDLDQRRQQEIAKRRSGIIDEDFLVQFHQAIVFVAESEGFTVILRTDHDGLQWWSPVVDITDQVVERLFAITQ